ARVERRMMRQFRAELDMSMRNAVRRAPPRARRPARRAVVRTTSRARISLQQCARTPAASERGASCELQRQVGFLDGLRRASTEATCLLNRSVVGLSHDATSSEGGYPYAKPVTRESTSRTD